MNYYANGATPHWSSASYWDATPYWSPTSYWNSSVYWSGRDYWRDAGPASMVCAAAAGLGQAWDGSYPVKVPWKDDQTGEVGIGLVNESTLCGDVRAVQQMLKDLDYSGILVTGGELSLQDHAALTQIASMKQVLHVPFTAPSGALCGELIALWVERMTESTPVSDCGEGQIGYPPDACVALDNLVGQPGPPVDVDEEETKANGDEDADEGWWESLSSTQKGVAVGAGVVGVLLLGALVFGGGGYRSNREASYLKSKRWGRKSAPKKYRKLGATMPQDYAYPQGYKYPLIFHKGKKVDWGETRKHIIRAKGRFTQYKHRYPASVRRTIAKNINRAARFYSKGNPEGKKLSADVKP